MGAQTRAGKSERFEMKGKVLRRAAAAVLTLLASAALAQTRVEWDGAAWLVEDIRGRGVIDNAQTTLRIDQEGKASGSTGCNRFFGKAEIGGDRLRFGRLATTYRACPRALADQERKFLGALAAAHAARFDRMGRLQIISARGEALLTLTRM